MTCLAMEREKRKEKKEAIEKRIATKSRCTSGDRCRQQMQAATDADNQEANVETNRNQYNEANANPRRKIITYLCKKGSSIVGTRFLCHPAAR